MYELDERNLVQGRGTTRVAVVAHDAALAVAIDTQGLSVSETERRYGVDGELSLWLEAGLADDTAGQSLLSPACQGTGAMTVMGIARMAYPSRVSVKRPQLGRPQHGLRSNAHLLASGAFTLASEAMPAQAMADTPHLLTTDCLSGGVGRPSWGKLLSDIARYAENVRFSLASHAEKGTPFHKLACCELATLDI
ncbi:hypothetical protein HaLaN_27363 [Haematococcus lacustris]|uniref:Uncharacterized protein n=1 Tax=Haematococcus lacustris TaxID=44745 RepID=A0A6A0A8E4_HAELA|nr:hypothetical protein HaLaN_27363 [Haematococcus lacustris]